MKPLVINNISVPLKDFNLLCPLTSRWNVNTKCWSPNHFAVITTHFPIPVKFRFSSLSSLPVQQWRPWRRTQNALFWKISGITRNEILLLVAEMEPCFIFIKTVWSHLWAKPTILPPLYIYPHYLHPHDAFLLIRGFYEATCYNLLIISLSLARIWIRRHKTNASYWHTANITMLRIVMSRRTTFILDKITCISLESRLSSLTHRRWKHLCTIGKVMASKNSSK